MGLGEVAGMFLAQQAESRRQRDELEVADQQRKLALINSAGLGGLYG